MNEQCVLRTKLKVSDYKVWLTLFDWQMISGKCSAKTPKQRPLKHQQHISSWRVSKMINSSVILYILLPHQPVSMVTRYLVMETGRLIWTFPVTSIYCAYTLFHFLTSTFFLSHRNTFHSPTYLIVPSLSLSLSLSIFLSDRISQCKRLVSRQVLRPIKLSTSLVDIKDANTQSAHGRQAHTDTNAHCKRWQQ